MKRIYRFYLADGTVAEAKNEDDLDRLDVLAQRKDQLEAHYVSEMHYERQWRDRELLLTDKLMYPDSTYNGQLVMNSDYYTEILAYRQRLHDYDLKYQPRPKRPEWFNPSEHF